MSQSSVVHSVVFSPDGAYILSGGLDKSARVWKISTGEEVFCMLHESEVISVAFSPDGKYAMSGSFDTTARIWLWQDSHTMRGNPYQGGSFFSIAGRFILSYSETVQIV